MGLGHGVGLGAWWNETFRVTLGDTGLGHGVGSGAWWNETFRATLGDTGLGHGVGLGDQQGGMRPLG